MKSISLSAATALPSDAARATLAGRVWRPDVKGPAVVAIRDNQVFDITRAFPTMRDLCETGDPADALRKAQGEPLGPLDAILANTPPETPRSAKALAARAARSAGGEGRRASPSRCRCSSA